VAPLPSCDFQPLESPATPRCDDRLSSGHHRRLIRRPPVTVNPVGGIKRRQIHLRHRVNHKPSQMIRRQPLPDIRRNKNPCSRPLSMKFCGIPESHRPPRTEPPLRQPPRKSREPTPGQTTDPRSFADTTVQSRLDVTRANDEPRDRRRTFQTPTARGRHPQSVHAERRAQHRARAGGVRCLDARPQPVPAQLARDGQLRPSGAGFVLPATSQR
jgi:hypothetical protein